MSDQATPKAGKAGRSISPVTLDDLFADLVWPRLLKAAGLALRPARLGLAAVFVIGFVLLVGLAGWADRQPDKNVLKEDGFVPLRLAVRAFAGSIHEHLPEPAAKSLYDIFISVPGSMIRHHPVVTILFVLLALLWTGVFGGAISRMAATEFSSGVSLSWPQGLGFAVSKWKSLFAALAGPLMLIWAIALVLSIGGWALFNVSFLGLIGGLLWGLFLLGALVAVVVMIAYALGHPMLVPGVACEGTDAIDSIQHAYSFVFARPVRLILYTLLLLLEFAVMAFVVSLVVLLVIEVAREAASVWTNETGNKIIHCTPPGPGGKEDSGLTGLNWAAASMQFLWTAVPTLLIAAFAVSYYWCASTVLYLGMRRICDGQDMSELWMPGMVEGTMAQARGPAPAAGGGGGSPGQGIDDDGPADEG